MAIGSSSAILQDLDLSFTYVVYIIINNHIKKSSCQNINICGFQSHITAKTTRRRPVRLEYTLIALAATVFILDPPNPIWGDSGWLKEQFGAPYDHLESK